MFALMSNNKPSSPVKGSGCVSVAHTVSSIMDLSAGPSHSIPGLARAQSNLGASVTVHSTGRPDEANSIGFVDKRYPTDWQSWPIVNQLKLSSIMLAALRNENCDIIHNHGLWLMPNVYSGYAVKRSATKLVFAPRGMLSSVALGFSPLKKKAFGLLAQNRTLKRVNLFHATSQQECEEIWAYGLSQPVAIIPNGIDLPLMAILKTKSSPRKTILSLGRIHPKKGLDMLVRAWSKLEAAFPNWDLMIVGPNENGHAGELKALVKELKLKHVVIRGPVFGEAKTAMLASADVFALPTKSENFAMTVAESLAAGTPVISTRGAPWQGLQQERCGWWIDIGAEPMAETLRIAMSLSSPERSRMGQRGRAWMERDFSWDGIAQKTLDAYSWLLEGGEPPETIRFSNLGDNA